MKTPLPILILMMIFTLVRFFTKKHPGESQTNNHIYFIVPVMAYLTNAIMGRFNIGYRHLLLIIPFIYIWIGCDASKNLNKFTKAGIMLVGLMSICINIITFPDFISYSNLTYFGIPPIEYLSDSNLDWGQDLQRLAIFQKKNNIDMIYLSYFGTADPKMYDMMYQCLPGMGIVSCPEGKIPEKGWVAISATCLQGLCTPDHDFYKQFRDKTPTAMIGQSIYIYHIP